MRKLLRYGKKRLLDIIYRVSYRVMTQKPKCDLLNLASGKYFRLHIPTYDGSGQGVHPSVLIRSGAPPFILSFTPYTDTDDRVVNPSIVVSDDGLVFREEQTGLNPLVPAPERIITTTRTSFVSMENTAFCI